MRQLTVFGAKQALFELTILLKSLTEGTDVAWNFQASFEILLEQWALTLHHSNGFMSRSI